MKPKVVPVFLLWDWESYADLRAPRRRYRHRPRQRAARTRRAG